MSGNQSISGALSVAGGISTPSLTATSGTIASLSCSSLSVSGMGSATFQNLTTTAATTGTLMATSQISAPTVLVAGTNVGTRLNTLESDLDVAETNLATVLTRTNNQSYAAGTGTTTFTGTLSVPNTLQLAGTNVGTRLSTLETDLDDAEQALDTVKAKTTNQSFASSTNITSFSGILSASTLLVGAGNANVGTTLSGLESRTANQSTSGTTTTFSGPVSLSDGATVAANKTLNLQGNLSANTGTFAGALQANAGLSITGGLTSTTAGLTVGGAIMANGGLQVPSGKTLVLTGNISANSTTVSPTDVSRIQGLTSNAQTQLTALQGKTANQTASGTTTTFSGTLAAASISLNGTDLATTLNSKVSTDGAGNAAVQTLLANDVTVSGIVAPRYLVLKDNDGTEQSVLYQDEEVLYYAHQYNGGVHRVVAKDLGGVQKVALDITANTAAFGVPVSATSATVSNATITNLTATSATIPTANLTALNGSTLRTTNNGGSATWAPASQTFLPSNYVSSISGHPHSGRIGTITAPARAASKVWVSCPVGFAHSRAAPVGSNFVDSRMFVVADFRWLLVSSTGTVLASGQPRYHNNSATEVAGTRAYTFNNNSSQGNLFYKQYIANVVCDLDIPFSEQQASFDVYLSLGQAKVVLNYSTAEPTPSSTYYSMRSTDGGLTWYSGTASATYVSVGTAAGTGYSAVACTFQLGPTSSLTGGLETDALATRSLAVSGPIVSTNPFPSYLGGYITTPSGPVPILCSMTDTQTLYGGGVLTNNDYNWLILPGYRVVPYRHPNYQSGGEYANLSRFDNTTGTSPIYVPESVRDLGSMKVYYRGVEVVVSGLS